LDYAKEHNPELAASRFEVDAAQARREGAGVWADPVLRTELMDLGNQGANSALNVLPGQVGSTRYLLMQSLPWYGKSALQRGVAGAQVSQAQSQTEANWADLASRIKTNYAMNYFLSASERLAEKTRLLLTNLERIVSARYANGLASQQEVIQVQIESSMLQSELIALQNERHHAHAQLNTLLARPINSALEEPNQFRTLPSPAKLDEAALLDSFHQHNPQLQIAEAALYSAEKNRDLAQLSRYPGITLGVASTQSGNAIKSWDLMLEFNLPLQQATRHSQIGEADALRAAAMARQQVMVNQLESALGENLSALLAARRTEELLSRRLLPQSEMAFQASLSSYQQGKSEFAQLMAAQRQIFQWQLQLLKAQFEEQVRLAELEKILGETL
jgi:outer membrane protein TolC